MARAVVVGGGVLGTLHSHQLVATGFEVVQLEADALPNSASVRNFGLLWVSGRRSGEELTAARRARRIWESIAQEVPGIGLRAAGSLTVSVLPEELKVMEDYANGADAAERNIEFLEQAALRRLNPALSHQVLGALWAPEDGVVEPQRLLGALRAHLFGSERYQFVPNRIAVDAETGAVVDNFGQRWEGDLVVLAVGAIRSGLIGAHLESAPLRRVGLQMMSTVPFEGELTTAVADADTMRYYPAYRSARLEDLPPRSELSELHEIQLLLVQRADGSLTIGDTHTYEEPFDFAVLDQVANELLGRVERVLGAPVPPVARRWSGVYSQCTDDRLCYRAEVLPGVWVVTGAGGRGMTCAPAIAEDTLTLAGVA
jgi:FAD dependent oxidoreductase TIGR03364